MICGLLAATSLTIIVAVRAPIACGLNVTEMVQCPLPATLLPQVSVSVKSPGFAPAKLIPLKPNGVGMWLVRVTILAGLVEKTGWMANARVTGVKVT